MVQRLSRSSLHSSQVTQERVKKLSFLSEGRASLLCPWFRRGGQGGSYLPGGGKLAGGHLRNTRAPLHEISSKRLGKELWRLREDPTTEKEIRKTREGCSDLGCPRNRHQKDPYYSYPFHPQAVLQVQQKKNVRKTLHPNRLEKLGLP